MGGITHADLIAVQTFITHQVREDITDMKAEISDQIAALRTRLDQQAADIRELRTTLEARTTATVLTLTPAQKKLLWTAGSGVGVACLEGLRHICGWLLAWLSHGVPTP